MSGNRTDTSKDKVENVHGTPRLKVIGTAETSNVPKRQETNKKDVPKTPTPKEMQERNKQKTSNNEKMKSNKKPKFNEARPSGPFTEKPKVTPIRFLLELYCRHYFLSAHNLLSIHYYENLCEKIFRCEQNAIFLKRSCHFGTPSKPLWKQRSCDVV